MNTMFLLESEVSTAMEAFVVKFADIVARRRVLFGTDPFIAVELSRDALIRTDVLDVTLCPSRNCDCCETACQQGSRHFHEE